MLSRPDGVGYDSTGDGGSDSPLAQSESAAALLQQPATHAKKLSTFSLSWLMLTDIVGTSVLTLAEVGSKLGWAWLVAVIVCMCPVAVYSAVMMVRTRTEMVLAGMEPPTSMGHAASLLFPGSRVVAIAVYCVVYGYAILGNSSYLLVIGNSLQGALCVVVSCCSLTRNNKVIIIRRKVCGDKFTHRIISRDKAALSSRRKKFF